MLTKEECLEACCNLYVYTGTKNCGKPSCTFCEENGCECETKLEHENAFSVINQLIEKHFDNPPLKFEELKEGMWIWDSYRKLWFKVDAMFTNPVTNIKYFIDFIRTIEFEENRFFRKQVQEDE